MAGAIAPPRRRPRLSDAERWGHCGVRGCTCTHLREDPLFPEAPRCDRGWTAAPPGATTPRGNPVQEGTVARCPVCRKAARLAANGVR
jgi:hypothetical protein